MQSLAWVLQGQAPSEYIITRFVVFSLQMYYVIGTDKQQLHAVDSGQERRSHTAPATGGALTGAANLKQQRTFTLAGTLCKNQKYVSSALAVPKTWSIPKSFWGTSRLTGTK
jgi:hypothetical protein